LKAVDVKQDRPRVRFLPVPSSDHANGDHGSLFHFVPQPQSASAVAHIHREGSFREVAPVPAEPANLDRIFHIDARLTAPVRILSVASSAHLIRVSVMFSPALTFAFGLPWVDLQPRQT
jgi:hypothetical protein